MFAITDRKVSDGFRVLTIKCDTQGCANISRVSTCACRVLIDRESWYADDSLYVITLVFRVMTNGHLVGTR